MKKTIPLFLSLVIYFSASAQEHTMPDGKKMSDKKMDNQPIKTNNTKIKPSVNPIKISANNVPSKTVRYDLYVGDTTVNFTGKNAAAMAINGQIPAPTLHFTEGIQH